MLGVGGVSCFLCHRIPMSAARIVASPPITADAIAGSISYDAQRLSSGAFDATPVFAVAKIGGGSNVTCSDLLALTSPAASYAEE